MLARTDRLYVKQYEEETNMRVQILLDTSGSMNYSHERRITKLQVRLLSDRDFIVPDDAAAGLGGLTTFDTQIGLDMPARSSPRHFNEMMHRLEAIQPGGETEHRRHAAQAGQAASNAAA